MQRRSLAQEPQEFPPDDAAFFDRYGPAIFAYILKHVRSREDAEDLTLEVFIAALEKKTLSQLRPEEQLAWLKRVTHNKLIDAYRKAQHRGNVTIEIVAEMLYSDDEPERVVLQREVDHQLHQHIQQLPNFNDFVYEVQMKIIKGDAGGIIFRINRASNGTSDGYVFRVGQDGSYFFYFCPLNATTCSSSLLQGSSGAINKGLNQTNVVAVIVKGNAIMLYVNQQKIGSTTDNTFSQGQIGVIAYDISNLTEVMYNNARVWTL